MYMVAAGDGQVKSKSPVFCGHQAKYMYHVFGRLVFKYIIIEAWDHGERRLNAPKTVFTSDV